MAQADALGFPGGVFSSSTAQGYGKPDASANAFGEAQPDETTASTNASPGLQ